MTLLLAFTIFGAVCFLLGKEWEARHNAIDLRIMARRRQAERVLREHREAVTRLPR